MQKLASRIVAALLLLGSAEGLIAEEELVFTLDFEDGRITPLRLEVPAGKRFKIEIRNKGKSAAEFEMAKPHREKVLAPGAQSFVVFRTLDPGEYEFVDEFHPEAPKGVIVAR